VAGFCGAGNIHLEAEGIGEMILSHHHVSFTVSNLQKTEAFFEQILQYKRIGGGHYDFPYIKRQVGYPDAVLEIALLTHKGEPFKTTGFMIELIEYVRPKCDPTDTSTCRPGSAHLCFLVEDLRSEYERMVSLGVEFISSPNEVSYGANKGALAVYFKGPDNIRLEMLQPANSRK
jgi:catechol 2,3-dioxygenase-like lactoylglutathione lyase family enzyme